MNMAQYPYPLPSSTGNLIPPKRQNKNAGSVPYSELERALGSIWRKRQSFLWFTCELLRLTRELPWLTCELCSLENQRVRRPALIYYERDGCRWRVALCCVRADDSRRLPEERRSNAHDASNGRKALNDYQLFHSVSYGLGVLP